MPQVPHVPGPTYRPAVAAPHAQPAAAGPVVGASVDLAHELAALRKLQTTTLLAAGVTAVFAVFAAVFSGFVAYVLWTFLGALHKAFG